MKPKKKKKLERQGRLRDGLEEPDQKTKPWMCRKIPTVLSKLIETNQKAQPVLISGVGIQARPIMDLNSI